MEFDVLFTWTQSALSDLVSLHAVELCEHWEDAVTHTHWHWKVMSIFVFEYVDRSLYEILAGSLLLNVDSDS